jgi:thioredoxin-like negative regulator of GroEL
MALDFPLAGAGRGAFLAAFPPYQTQPDVWTYTHPENIAAQYLTEWGLPVGALALLGLLFVLGRAALRPPIRAYNAAAIAAAFALLLQNTVDFSLEYLGAALPFIAVLAVVREVGAVGDRERVRRRSHPRLRLPGPVWFALPLATVAVLVWVYPRAAAQDLDAESGRFRLYAAADEYHPRMLDDAREAFARHPADYFLPYLAGLHLARSGHGSPIAFWNQALRLRPNSSAVHYAVATWLARFPATRGQAAGEFGLAVRCRPDVLPHAADAVARVLPEFSRTEEFVRLARPDPLPVWNALAAAYERLGRTAAAAAADRAILEAAPGHPQARFRRAAAALGDGRPGEAIDHLRRCSFFGFRHAERFLLEARALTALGHATEAVALLERAIAVVDSPEIPTALADLHVALGDLDAAERALAVLEARARTQADRSDAVVRRVRILVKAEHFADAFTQTRRTLGIDPGRVDLWVLAADLAERLDDIPGELWALRELVRRRPKDEALRERLRAVEARATEIRVLQYR